MTDDTASAGHGFSIVPNWMIQDSRVTGPMLTTYAALASYADRTGVCWPSVRALGERARLGPTALREALTGLERLGVLSRTARARQDGGRTSDLYRIAVHERGLTPPSFAEGGSPHETRGAPSPGEGHEQDPPNNTHSPLQAPQGAEPIEGLEGPPVGTPDLFDTFWAQYPRKVGKPQARRAWLKALKTGVGPLHIIGAAMAYAEDPNREAAFTKHPSTWLNAEGWNDGPLPERAPDPQVSAPWAPPGGVAPAPERTMSERVIDCAQVGRAHRPLADGTCMLCETRVSG